MGIPIVINGVRQTLTGDAAENYLHAAPVFRVWHVDPMRVVQKGNPYGDSPTPDITAAQTEPSYLWTPADELHPLQIPAGGTVWVIPEKVWSTVYVGSGYMLDPAGLSQSWWLKIHASGTAEFWGSDPALGNGAGGWGEFLKDLGDGALKAGVVAGVIVGGLALAGVPLGAAPVAGAGASVALPATVAGSGAIPAAGMAGVSDWAIATAGMSEGMGTAAAASSGGGLFSSVLSGVDTAVKTAQKVAAATVATRKAVDVIKAAADAPTPAQKVAQETAVQSSNNSMLLVLGVVLLALV